MNVRFLALNLLYDIYAKKAYSNLELDQVIRSNQVKDVDKALLTNIVYGSLQNYQLLEYELSKVIEKKNYKIKIKLLLISSLYQIRFLTKVPSYAIINEAVEIAKELDGVIMANFVNAILRKLASNNYQPQIADFNDKLEYYSLIYSHPLWLTKMWVKHYGEEITLKILQANKKEAPLTLRVNTLKTSKEKLLKKSEYAEAKLSKDALYYLGKDSLSDLIEFKNGEISAQDESSQMSSLVLNPTPNSYLLDMCAAPGSKTAHLAQIMNNNGKIIAVDIHQHRLDLLEKGLKRLGVNIIKTLCYDSTKLTEKFETESFDYILLDAPCSGFGVIRRKPDMLINSHQDSLDEIIKLQQNLFDEAVSLLKVDGLMVYSTCTLNKKENEQQVERIINKYPYMKLETMITIFPFEYDSDGFFVAKLKKVGMNNV